MKPVTRITDMHTCPQVTVIIPHVGGPVVGPGVPTVLAEKMPVAVVGDACTCVGPPDVIVEGSMNVLAMNRPIAALGAKTAHGGVVVAGAPTVVVGTATGGMLPPKRKTAKEAADRAVGSGQEAPSVSVAAKRSEAQEPSAHELVLPTYTLQIDLEQIDARYDDDELILESECGAYKQKRTVREDGVLLDDRWLEITFSKVKPGKIYSCHHDLKQTESGQTAERLLFKGMRLDPRDLEGADDLTEAELEEDQPLETLAELAASVDTGDGDPMLTIEEVAIWGDDDDGLSGGAPLEELPTSFWLGKEASQDEWALPESLPPTVKAALEEGEAEAQAEIAKGREERDQEDSAAEGE